MTDREYLERKLRDLKIEKENLIIQNMVSTTVFDAVNQIKDREILSIEKQLERGEE